MRRAHRWRKCGLRYDSIGNGGAFFLTLKKSICFPLGGMCGSAPYAIWYSVAPSENISAVK